MNNQFPLFVHYRGFTIHGRCDGDLRTDSGYYYIQEIPGYTFLQYEKVIEFIDRRKEESIVINGSLHVSRAISELERSMKLCADRQEYQSAHDMQRIMRILKQSDL